MKKVLVLLTLVAAVSAYSQGTVNFVTRDVGNGVNMRVIYAIDTGAPIQTASTYPDANVSSFQGYGGQYALAGLYGAAEGGTMQLLGVAVPFFSGTYRGYVNAGSDTARVVQGAPGNTLAQFQVKVWDTGGVGTYANYEDALASGHGYFGESAVLHNIVLGNYTPPGGTPTPSAALAGLNNSLALTIHYVPEPSIIGLGILGAVAGLMVFRRRN